MADINQMTGNNLVSDGMKWIWLELVIVNSSRDEVSNLRRHAVCRCRRLTVLKKIWTKQSLHWVSRKIAESWRWATSNILWRFSIFSWPWGGTKNLQSIQKLRILRDKLTLLIIPNEAQFSKRGIFSENSHIVTNFYLASFINDKSANWIWTRNWDQSRVWEHAESAKDDPNTIQCLAQTPCWKIHQNGWDCLLFWIEMLMPKYSHKQTRTINHLKMRHTSHHESL